MATWGVAQSRFLEESVGKMVSKDLLKAARTAVAVAALVALAPLAGCGERPYPSPAHEASAPAPPPTDLAGAPSVTPDVAPDAAGAYPPPPPVTAPPVDQPPPPPPVGADNSGGSAVVYDLGPVVGPPHAHSRVHSRIYTDRAATPQPTPAPVHRTHRVSRPAAPVVAAQTQAVTPRHLAPHTAPAHPHAAAVSAPQPPKVASKPAPVAKATPVVAKPIAPAAPATAARHASRSTVRKSTSKKTAAATEGAKAGHLTALQTALTDAVSSQAVLAAPDKQPAGQPADVSLTLPAAFAQTLHQAADKEGLTDDAASVNMTALLAGDGYAVTPEESQSQPLTVGQPTEFHWTVTAQPDAKGPLHADVGADLLGGGTHSLKLGAVQSHAEAGSRKIGGKMLGWIILAVIILGVLAWMANGRSNGRSEAARRAGRRAPGIAGSSTRPLDMGSEPAPRRDPPA